MWGRRCCNSLTTVVLYIISTIIAGGPSYHFCFQASLAFHSRNTATTTSSSFRTRSTSTRTTTGGTRKRTVTMLTTMNDCHMSNNHTTSNSNSNSKAGVVFTKHTSGNTASTSASASASASTSTSKPKKLILIRHGSSHANEYMDQDGNRWGDETFTDDANLVDSGLSPKGVQQARSLLKQLQLQWKELVNNTVEVVEPEVQPEMVQVQVQVQVEEASDAASMEQEQDSAGKDLDGKDHSCQELREALDWYLAAGGSDNDNGSNKVLIVTSPLTRAIETLSLGILPYINNSPSSRGGVERDGESESDGNGIIEEPKPIQRRIIGQPLASERVYTASDTGREMKELRQEFPFIDFDYATIADLGGGTGTTPCSSTADAKHQSKNQWWYTHDETNDGPYKEWRPNDGKQYYAVPGEPVEEFHQRMVELFQWIESRDEEWIILVTHWAVIRFFTGQEDVENCGVRVVDFRKVALKEGLVHGHRLRKTAA